MSLLHTAPIGGDCDIRILYMDGTTAVQAINRLHDYPQYPAHRHIPSVTRHFDGTGQLRHINNVTHGTPTCTSPSTKSAGRPGFPAKHRV